MESMLDIKDKYTTKKILSTDVLLVREMIIKFDFIGFVFLCS